MVRSDELHDAQFHFALQSWIVKVIILFSVIDSNVTLT